MKILAADTALGACSVAVLEDAQVLAHAFELMERGHAERLAPMAAEVMQNARLSFKEIDRLAVSTGPGTFTGQRVGIAFMRALRVALKKPLVGITTLAAMQQAARSETGLDRAVALHDARRDEVYLEVDGEPAVLPFQQAIALLAPVQRGLVLAGTAAPSVKDELKEAILSHIRQPDALWVGRLARHMATQDRAPEPLYLRPPDAKLPSLRS